MTWYFTRVVTDDEPISYTGSTPPQVWDPSNVVREVEDPSPWVLECLTNMVGHYSGGVEKFLSEPHFFEVTVRTRDAEDAGSTITYTNYVPTDVLV
jgi:hypothetical protein